MDGAFVNELATEIFQNTVFSYADTAAMVLIIYDTLLTFGDELDLIWGKRLNLGSISYLLARYCTILTQIVEDIVDGLALLSDAAVIIITLYFAWKEFKNVRSVFENKRTSLTVIFVHQGILRFIVIFLWLTENIVNVKVLTPFLRGIDTSPEDSVSVILVCRFLLVLRKFNTSPQSVPSVNIETIPGPVSGIQGRLQQLNNSIIQDFGGSGPNNYESESDDTMDNQETSAAHSGGGGTELGITAEEFPWAIPLAQNTIVETGGPSRAGGM
ncbi:hypothetical protein M422DRAFT_266513 [Sphaerobolus stellatus SS14]|uniref:DUF6533 domain-containing protein n=1 Tax=Sphaerobolus stellatus (strain SS14) TaxID=990650 RepID=A0A0C9URC9_SPHS4|nr:hypothetical protein M422DRAFT_266513 [Sphaerobolus stellatus SS14]